MALQNLVSNAFYLKSNVYLSLILLKLYSNKFKADEAKSIFFKIFSNSPVNFSS